jgi:hypothetical protein
MSNPVQVDRQTRQGGWLRQAIRAAFWIALVAITALALTPGPAMPPVLLGADKLKHVAAFATLAGLVRLGWPGLKLWIVAAVLMAHGAFLEIVQGSPILQREMSLADLAAGAIGIALGFAAIWLFHRVRRA